MAEVVYELEDGERLAVDLREPYWAALLAWLWPGAGHFYQRRFAKGFLFMTCVLTIFFLGIFWGTSRVVYASFSKEDFRWQFLCQAGVGLPAFPAIIQAFVTKGGNAPLWPLAHRHPLATEMGGDNRFRQARRSFQRVTPDNPLPEGEKALVDGFMAPPAGQVNLNENDVLGTWHSELGHFFEIGTLYTLTAGLLNMLAIYDAFVGPAIMSPEEREKLKKKKAPPETSENATNEKATNA